MSNVTMTMVNLCKGRDGQRQEILKVPVEIKVIFNQAADFRGISTIVECVYNTGGHGHRCKASHPDRDKIGDGIFCPYAIDLPYTIDRATFKK